MALGTKQKQLTGVLLAVTFCCVKLIYGKTSVAKLQIGIKHRPAACSRRAQPGDEVSIHYTVRGLAVLLLMSWISYSNAILQHRLTCVSAGLYRR